MQTRIKDEALHIALEGALDSHTAAEFKAWVEENLLDGYRGFLLNFSRLDYISSRGISVLLEVESILKRHGARMVILEPAEETRNLLKFFQIDEKIPVLFDWESAVRELASYRKVEPTAAPESEPEAFPILEEANDAPATSNESSEEEASGSEKEPAGENSPGQEVPQELATEESKPEDVHEEVAEVPALPQGEATEEESHAEASPTSEPSEVEREESFTEGPATDMSETKEAPEQTESTNPLPANAVVHCPNCGRKLKVGAPGKYLCPDCRVRFQYPFV